MAVVIRSDGGGREGDEPTAVVDDDDGSGADDDLATVRRQDLASKLEVDGVTIRRTVPVAVPEGLVLTVEVAGGSAVAVGQRVARYEPAEEELIAAERQVEDAESALAAARAEWQAERSASPTPPVGEPASVVEAERQAERAQEDLDRLFRRGGEVLAPAAGLLVVGPGSRLAVDQGRAVRAPLQPLALLRLRSGLAAGTASIETTAGQRIVPCRSVVLEEPGAGGASLAPDGEATTRGAGGSENPQGAAVCILGPDVDTVDGLDASLSIEVAYGSDVLVVPEIAVGYAEDGAPFLTAADGTTLPVVLGPGNGVLRVVVEGAGEGTDVRLPSAEGPTP